MLNWLKALLNRLFGGQPEPIITVEEYAKVRADLGQALTELDETKYKLALKSISLTQTETKLGAAEVQLAQRDRENRELQSRLTDANGIVLSLTADNNRLQQNLLAKSQELVLVTNDREENAQLKQQVSTMKQTIDDAASAGGFPPAIRQNGKQATAPLMAPQRARLWWACEEALHDVFGSPTDTYGDSAANAVLPLFDPSKTTRLASINPLFDVSVRTARSQTFRETQKLSAVQILLSPDWHKFAPYFQRYVMVHEFLHILEAESGLDIGKFYKDVQEWYGDPETGQATPEGNYVKYTLFHELYDPMTTAPEHIGGIPGVEEFAYIGTLLAKDQAFISQVGEKVRAYYKGVLAEV